MDDTDNLAIDPTTTDNPEFPSLDELDAAENALLESLEKKEEPGKADEEGKKEAPKAETPPQGDAFPVTTGNKGENRQDKPEALPKAQGPQPVNARRALRKDEIIANILKLQDQIPNYTVRSKTYYTRKKVAELDMILADLMKRGAETLQGITSVSTEDVINADDLPKVQQVPQFNAGSAMFQFNIIVAQFLEAVSINFEDKIGTNLQGFTMDLVENRKELEECLSEIYVENSEMLNQYLNGTNRYFLLMTSLGGGRLVKNIKKKDSEEEEDA
jgi:hypothetical protein